jgi:hypothetical protein
MTNFFKNLKEIFEEIPAKTRFLKDLGLNNSYTGFRYFMQNRKEEPSTKFMNLLCQELGYKYTLLPIKDTEEHNEIKNKLHAEFETDLKEHLKKYEKDPSRLYAKNYGQESSVSSAIEAFREEEEILLDPSKKIDVSDLF